MQKSSARLQKKCSFAKKVLVCKKRGARLQKKGCSFAKTWCSFAKKCRSFAKKCRCPSITWTVLKWTPRMQRSWSLSSLRRAPSRRRSSTGWLAGWVRLRVSTRGATSLPCLAARQSYTAFRWRWIRGPACPRFLFDRPWRCSQRWGAKAWYTAIARAHASRTSAPASKLAANATRAATRATPAARTTTTKGEPA